MVSVIIPTYNREKSVLAAVNSVLSQTYKDKECSLYDYGLFSWYGVCNKF